MHPQTRRELRGMLLILDERGEEELFRFVKDYLKGYPIPSQKVISPVRDTPENEAKWRQPA